MSKNKGGRIPPPIPALRLPDEGNDEVRRRRRRVAIGGTGRSDTILTGPASDMTMLGGAKTLLGG